MKKYNQVVVVFGLKIIPQILNPYVRPKLKMPFLHKNKINISFC